MGNREKLRRRGRKRRNQKIRRSNVKKLVVALTVFMAVFCLFLVWSFSRSDTEIRVVKDAKDTYSLTTVREEGEKYKRFDNYVDGYSVLLAKDFRIDMSEAQVYALATNKKTRIEIYKEPVADGAAKDGYIHYSNGFTANTVDHQVTYTGFRQFGDNEVYVTTWQRPKAAALKSDYHYYASLDIVTTAAVYSLFVKSQEPIKKQDYTMLATSFTPTAIKVQYDYPATAPVKVTRRGWNRETAAFYRQYFGDKATLTWGLFDPLFAQFDFSAYRRIEKEVGYEFPIMVWYNHIAKKPDVTYWQKLLEESHSRGKVLELTLQTPLEKEGEGNMVYAVLNGEYDDYLTAYAQTIAEFGHPVLLRLGNEMNGDWCPYAGYRTGKDTLVFKEFYRYIYDIFESERVKNAIWVWNPNGESKPDFTWNHPLMYYPGDEYVDVIGLTAYNTGTYHSEHGETWRSFTELYDGFYEEYLSLFGQPFMITEFASASQGGDKAQWIRDMFRDMGKYPELKIAIWWGGCDYDTDGSISRSYVMDESPEVLEAFRQGFKEYAPKK